jgi:hypothetical protein
VDGRDKKPEDCRDGQFDQLLQRLARGDSGSFPNGQTRRVAARRNQDWRLGVDPEQPQAHNHDAGNEDRGPAAMCNRHEHPGWRAL